MLVSTLVCQWCSTGTTCDDFTFFWKSNVWLWNVCSNYGQCRNCHTSAPWQSTKIWARHPLELNSDQILQMLPIRRPKSITQAGRETLINTATALNFSYIYVSKTKYETPQLASIPSWNGKWSRSHNSALFLLYHSNLPMIAILCFTEKKTKSVFLSVPSFIYCCNAANKFVPVFTYSIMLQTVILSPASPLVSLNVSKRGKNATFC